MLRTISPLSEAQERIITQVVDCGFSVHSCLGPGFREVIYKRAFQLELGSRGLAFESEKRIEVKYRHWSIPGQTVDLLVEGFILVELKAVPKLKSLHRKQVLSYLRTLNLRVGLLINFNAELYKHGVKRVIL